MSILQGWNRIGAGMFFTQQPMQMLYPTTAWQTLKVAGKRLEIDDNFYVKSPKN